METNQPTPFVDVNLFTSDEVLRQTLAREGLHTHTEDLATFGVVAGSAAAQEFARQANDDPPVLHAYDPVGNRLDEVTFHPAYHELMALSAGQGLTFGSSEPGIGHLARAAGFYLSVQMEPGHCCPVTMTNAALPVLMRQGGIARDFAERAMVRRYDPRSIPARDKDALTFGMGMTERQGGSDVRTNTTRAEPAGGHYLIHGEKWFLSAPMSDAFLVLAQTSRGLSAFLVPRFGLDGQRNAIHFRRLKNKLGNRSNASSEAVFAGAEGHLVGEEGRGIATIIEMVTLTRLDCAVSSAALMRAALAIAINFCRQRVVFGRLLIDQPLMRQVLADLALDVEAATALVFRLASAFDRQTRDEADAAFVRVMTPIIKFWVCKALPGFVYEAMECLGGNGYVEDFPLARLYREAPINAIWEGSGNIMCLDVARIADKDPAAIAKVLSDYPLADRAAAALGSHNRASRREVEAIAARVALSLLRRNAPSAVADAYEASRCHGGFHRFYGSGLEHVDIDLILARASPKSG